MSAEIKEMLTTIELYISQVDSLLNKAYREGKDEKEELYYKLGYFILLSVPDAEERFTELTQSLPISYSDFGIEETEAEKQAYYISYLKTMRNTLVSFKEELQIKIPKENIINQPV